MAFLGDLAVVEDPEERRIVEPGQMYTPGYLFEQEDPLSEPMTDEPGLVRMDSFDTSVSDMPTIEAFRRMETTEGEEVSCFLPQLHQIPFDDNNDREFTLGMGPMIGSELDDITDGITANLEGLLEDISYMVPVSANNVRILNPTSPTTSRPTTRIIHPSQMQPLSSRSPSSAIKSRIMTEMAHSISHPTTQIVQPTPTQLLSSHNTAPAINVTPIHPSSATSSHTMHIIHPTQMHRLSSIPTIETPRKQPPRPTVENADDEEEWQAPVAPMHRPFTPEVTPHPTEAPFAKEVAPPPESPPRDESSEPASLPTPPPTLRRSTRKRATPKRYMDE